MDTSVVISFLQESLFIIVVFCGFLLFAMVRGRQALTNLILGLYLALLISLEFPYYTPVLRETGGESGSPMIMILIFAAFTILATIFFGRLMPRDYGEPAFERFNIKIVLAALGTILLMAYSYHVLPVTELITPGSPIRALFAPEAHFFWWLILPLVILFFL